MGDAFKKIGMKREDMVVSTKLFMGRIQLEVQTNLGFQEKESLNVQLLFEETAIRLR